MLRRNGFFWCIGFQRCKLFFRSLLFFEFFAHFYESLRSYSFTVRNSPALVKALFSPCAGSNWFTNKSHGKSPQTPQCSTLPVAQSCSLHSPQKGCPFWLPHPEQVGFPLLFKKGHVPQYVPQGATNFSLKHTSLNCKRLDLSYYSLLVGAWFCLTCMILSDK